MADEIIGELIVGVAEIGLEAASGSDRKKSAMGCLFMTIILCLLIGGIYYITTIELEPPIKGVVTKKLPNDKMVIKTQKGEDVYTINSDLYLNKKEGDSITITIKNN